MSDNTLATLSTRLYNALGRHNMLHYSGDAGSPIRHVRRKAVHAMRRAWHAPAPLRPVMAAAARHRIVRFEKALVREAANLTPPAA